MKQLMPPSSGSHDAMTASRNRFGQYWRKRATPVNPSSVPQMTVRSRMATNAAAWRALTDVQRAGWASLGEMMPRTDSLGQVYTLTGFAAYCSVNNNLATVGDSLVSAAPALATPPDLATVTLTLTSAAFSVAYTATPLAAGNRALIFASPQRSAGRSFEGDYRLIAVTAAAAASPADIFSAYSARLGTPVTGNRIFVKVITQELGFQGSPFGVSQVVA